MADISVQAVVEPFLTALAPLGFPADSYIFPAEFLALPVINQAYFAKYSGSYVTAGEVLDILRSVRPLDVYNAQKYIQDHKDDKPADPGTGGGSKSGTKPPPPPPPPPPAHPPIIMSEIAGPGDDFFTPIRFTGHGFAKGEAIALIQVLNGLQSPLAPAASDGSGYMDKTVSLNSNSHYNVFALGVTSNTPSNTIGVDVP